MTTPTNNCNRYRVFYRNGRDVKEIIGRGHGIGQHNGVLEIYRQVESTELGSVISTDVFRDWEHVEVIPIGVGDVKRA